MILGLAEDAAAFSIKPALSRNIMLTKLKFGFSRMQFALVRLKNTLNCSIT